ncbi:MAG: hypothetical protein A3E78_11180 [Alphaproteobacteria bacterium RIFCSPHIGHO2_12_FULL_63_12]|nr:MAG: hypothetical protein A3E78_11180 [Alphaproteobacteria bacterium RIFCSPHIGHO2_12_FULL_63_12]
MGDKKYKAFISYSHADEAWAGWLQRALERFRAPGKLAAALKAKGAPARLSPVFRDREDFPVAGNLNAAIQAALAASEFQIVLCSPRSARSTWVNEEIKLFHKLHGPGRVFALIIGGEPNASAIPGREEEECFPPALRFVLGADGEPTEAPAEPLAADARKTGDGKRYALLKVAAGMLGVGLDELVRRDAARRARQAWTVAGASVTGMAATLALSLFAVAKSNEATLMRGKAEDLIEFMLTDLNDKLEPVGRLDILEAVVARAMDYYADQDLKSLDDDALARRAKAMMQLGTIESRRNNLNAAQNAIDAAEAATGELLRRSPRDPDRIFDHAQNVFYSGEAALNRYDRQKAAAKFDEYLRLARLLMKVDGDNPRSRLELAYATSNIGSVKFEDGFYDEAIPYFRESIAARKALLEASPDDQKLLLAYAYAISWEALVELERGHYRAAADLFRRQLAAYGPLADPQSGNFLALNAVVTAQRRLADAHFALGEIGDAADANAAAETTADQLITRDATNANWSVNAAYVQRMKSALLSLGGDRAGAVEAADRSVDMVSAVLTDDADQTYFAALGQSLAWRLDLRGDEAAPADATRLGELIARAIESDVRDNANFIGAASLSLAAYDRRSGRPDNAAIVRNRAIENLESLNMRMPAAAKISFAALYLDAGRPKPAALIISELDALDVRRPDFIALRDNFLKIAEN